MDDDVIVDHGLERLTIYTIDPIWRLGDYLEDSLPDDASDTSCFKILLALLSIPAIFFLMILRHFLWVIMLIIYFSLTVYMETVFVFFTVLIAYYQVLKGAFYGYLCSLLIGLFIAWLNCDPAHFSKAALLLLLDFWNLKPVIRLLDIFGKFRSRCPVDGLPRAATNFLIFSKASMLIKALEIEGVLEKDSPEDLYRKSDVFEIELTKRGTATIMFSTDFDYFMKEFDWNEDRLGVVSKVFRRIFEERVPVGSFCFGFWWHDRFLHMRPGTIINRVMSGEEVLRCKVDESIRVAVL